MGSILPQTPPWGGTPDVDKERHVLPQARAAVQVPAEQPDAAFARKLQEVLGGQHGEITVAVQYGFQAWNTKIPGKYKDLLFGIGAEEFGHVEMLTIMIAELLEDAPAIDTESAVNSDPVMRQ